LIPAASMKKSQENPEERLHNGSRNLFSSLPSLLTASKDMKIALILSQTVWRN
jgi:hypothetical protein